MLYTRGEVKEQARVLMNSLGTEWLTDSQMNVLADQANELVYRDIVNHCPDMVTNTTAFTFPSSITSIDLSSPSYLGEVPMRIKTVEDTMRQGPYAPTNWVRQWEMTHYDEMLRYRSTRSGFQNPQTGMMPKLLYCIDQANLLIAPAQSLVLNCRIRWIPYLHKMTADSDAVLNGFASQFGQHVGYALAHLSNVRQGGANQAITQQYMEARENIMSTANERTRGPQLVHNSRMEQFR